MVEWSPERIAALTLEQIKSLRANAVRHGKIDLVEICDAEIAIRNPVRAKSPRVERNSPSVSRRCQVVVGYHFVCSKERGVTLNGDASVWTGTWVVEKRNAERSTTVGAYVALHEAKSEPSYLQGTIKDWRKAKRDREYVEGRKVKIEFGVDFLLELTAQSYSWSGEGAGEKGYVGSEQKK